MTTARNKTVSACKQPGNARGCAHKLRYIPAPNRNRMSVTNQSDGYRQKQIKSIDAGGAPHVSRRVLVIGLTTVPDGGGMAPVRLVHSVAVAEIYNTLRFWWTSHRTARAHHDDAAAASAVSSGAGAGAGELREAHLT